MKKISLELTRWGVAAENGFGGQALSERVCWEATPMHPVPDFADNVLNHSEFFISGMELLRQRTDS